tara:strand:+ start:726 stop:1973 length:1248 start_codon:yes stop_codon:yes gene_type:complete
MAKIFILELNEFNLDILKYYSKKYKLTNIKKILKFHSTKTFTKDRYLGNNNQFGYLDPWSQWVSIHTQKEAKIHKIKNLGDIPSLKIKQIWEKRHEDFYIWGPMNASKKNAKNVKVFFPDPWVYSEKAYPVELNKLLKPIKQITKSRGVLPSLEKIVIITKLIKNLINLAGFKVLKYYFYDLLKGYFKFGNKQFVQIIAWEKLAFKIFIKYFKGKDKFLSIYFFNALAHVQHHYWSQNKVCKEIIYCLENLDTIIKNILAIENTELIIFNGLSQKNSEKDGLYLYEQISHELFLRSLGINFKKVENLMTNDAHIFFSSKKETQKCFKILKSISFKSQKIFYVEIIEKNKIFYKTNYIKKVSIRDKLIINNKKMNFLKHFKLITLRRGIHSHSGNILSQKNIFPRKIQNHYFFNYI